MTKSKSGAASKRTCSEPRKFAKKLDTYCKTFSAAQAVAQASGIPEEDLQAIREKKRLITEPEKKRILDRFPNINR